MTELAPAPGAATNPDNGDGGAAKTTNPQPGTTPEPPVAADAGFDPSKLGDDEFAKVFDDKRVFAHPRFKELNDRAKRATELEKAQEDAEKKSLEESGKWKELAEKEQAKSAQLATQVQAQAQNSSLMIAAQAAGIGDLDAALKLVDRANIAVDENGSVSGAEEAIKALVESKPYLVGNKPPVKVGSPSNPATSSTDTKAETTADGKRIYKLSELQDTKFYRENAADIKLAMKEGRTINDIGAAVGAAGGQ